VVLLLGISPASAWNQLENPSRRRLNSFFTSLKGPPGRGLRGPGSAARTMRRPRANRSRERASHQAIDGNLKLARAHVNGYVLLQTGTGWDLVNGASW
jgi:hypothetical protein